MSCSCAKITDQYHGWECSVSGGECMFFMPNSKACAEIYGEGPDAVTDKCEDCINFYKENDKRCCKTEPLRFVDEEPDLVKSKYIEDDIVYCGLFKSKEGETS